MDSFTIPARPTKREADEMDLARIEHPKVAVSKKVKSDKIAQAIDLFHLPGVDFISFDDSSKANERRELKLLLAFIHAFPSKSCPKPSSETLAYRLADIFIIATNTLALPTTLKGNDVQRVAVISYWSAVSNTISMFDNLRYGDKAPMISGTLLQKRLRWLVHRLVDSRKAFVERHGRTPRHFDGEYRRLIDAMKSFQREVSADLYPVSLPTFDEASHGEVRQTPRRWTDILSSLDQPVAAEIMATRAWEMAWVTDEGIRTERMLAERLDKLVGDLADAKADNDALDRANFYQDQELQLASRELGRLEDQLDETKNELEQTKETVKEYDDVLGLGRD